MAERSFMPVTADEIPVSKTFVIDGQQYLWEFHYNSTHDFYTVIIKDDVGDIIYVTKIVLDVNILHAKVDLGIISEIVPRDFTLQSLRIGEDEFGDPVKIYVEDV